MGPHPGQLGRGEAGHGKVARQRMQPSLSRFTVGRFGQRGFERAYWFNLHSNDFFAPYEMYEGNSMIQAGGEGYYLTDDLTRLFNMLSGYAPDASFKSLLVSPNGVREGLTERIEREIEFHEAGKPARIQIKVNSLVDEQIIDSLYRASQAGVPVDVLVRGMCALKPGVPGLSENIRVRSVLGRYLEHSRVFTFAGGGDPEIFIGSADMMHRNLDRRVEALVRIAQPDHIKELQDLFALAMSDDSSSWHLETNGTWSRHQFDANGKKLIDVQDELMRFTSSRRSTRK